jgi:anaerobic ribonucleoside-triphosphate reductase activating protein
MQHTAAGRGSAQWHDENTSGTRNRLEITCCVTPDSWDPAAGTVVPVHRLAQALLDPAFDRDGITIAGGEPFHQPEGLWALIQELRVRGCRHLLVYSGYTYERLRRMAGQQPAIDAILDEIDVLIDGPYVQVLAEGAGPWTGSSNQRVLQLRSGVPSLWKEDQ